MRQLFLSWEGGGFRVTARKHFLMVLFSMLDFTSDFLRLKTRAKSRFLAKTEFPSDFSRLKSRASSRALENCCGGRPFRVHSTLPVGSVQLRVRHLRVKNLDKMLAFGKIQLRVQHFGAEKLDNELNIKWERTFLMTCSKTGDVFLRQRLFCARKFYGSGCG